MKPTQQQIVNVSVSLDEQLLTLRLDNNRVALVPLRVLPRLADATYEEAHNLQWSKATRSVTWPKIDLTAGWDDLLTQATSIRRPRLQVSTAQVGPSNQPGVHVMYGKWQARLSWGQIAFWKDYEPLVWWLNPFVHGRRSMRRSKSVEGS